jgi:[histone H3]-lysine36 N-dimethyltransferase SETMAR
MSNFQPGTGHLREVLLFAFHLKKNARQAHQMLVEAYGKHAPSERMCYWWFDKFQSGNFDTQNEPRGKPPKRFEDTELRTLLDQDDLQTQEELAEQLGVNRSTVSRRLSAMGLIQKLSKWVPHELTERQQQSRQTICELLLARHERKSFLHRIVTGDEKWIFFENPKRGKSWTEPGTAPNTIAKQDRFGKKALLCVWWDQRGLVYYELLKPGETVTGERYEEQMICLEEALDEKRPEHREWHNHLILLHDNAKPHVSKDVKTIINGLGWETLSHPAYSPDLAPSDYHLFRSMAHALAEQKFSSYENVQIWVEEWFASKSEDFFRAGIRQLPERWATCIANQGNYF